MLTWWGGANLVALAVLILLSPFLAAYFRLDGAGPIFWAAGILLSGVLHPLNSGVFQGRQWMVLLGGLALLSSAVRLGIGGATAVWDLGVGGGLGLRSRAMRRPWLSEGRSMVRLAEYRARSRTPGGRALARDKRGPLGHARSRVVHER